MKRFGWKRLMLVITGLVVVLTGATLVWLQQFLTAPRLSALVQRQVTVKTDSLYSVSIDSVYVNLFSGTFQLHRIRMEPVKKAPKDRAVLSVALEALEINRIHVVRYLLFRRLYLSSIRLKGADISLLSGTAGETAAEKEEAGADSLKSPREMLALIPPVLQKVASRFKADTVSIEHASVHLKGNGSLNIRDLSAAFSELEIRPDPVLPVKTTDFTVSIAGVDVIPKGRFYHFKTEEIAATVADSEFTVKKLEVRSLQADDAFFKKKKYRGTRYKALLTGFSIKGWDFEALFFDRLINIKKVKSGSIHLDLLSDNRLPKRDTLRIKKYRQFPHEQIAAVRLPVDIDSMELRNIDFVYREFPEHAGGNSKPAVLHINKGKLLVTGIKNHHKKGSNEGMHLNLQAVIENHAKTEIKWRYPFGPGPWEGTLNGSITGLEPAKLNGFIAPLARVEFKNRAKFDRISFNAGIKNDHATGTIDALYDHLQIRVLRKNADQTRWFASTVGNVVLYEKNVKSADSPPRQGRIDVKRDTLKPFPAHLSALFMNGFMEILLPPRVTGLIKKQQEKQPTQRPPSSKKEQPKVPAKQKLGNNKTSGKNKKVSEP